MSLAVHLLICFLASFSRDDGVFYVQVSRFKIDKCHSDHAINPRNTAHEEMESDNKCSDHVG